MFFSFQTFSTVGVRGRGRWMRARWHKCYDHMAVRKVHFERTPELITSTLVGLGFHSLCDGSRLSKVKADIGFARPAPARAEGSVTSLGLVWSMHRSAKGSKKGSGSLKIVLRPAGFREWVRDTWVVPFRPDLPIPGLVDVAPIWQYLC